MAMRTRLAIGMVSTILAFGYSFACWAHGAQWPMIKSVQSTFNVRNVANSKVSLLIRSKSGIPLYRLRCAHPGYAGDYSGDFECRLDTIKGGDTKVQGSLLVEDSRQLKPWPSRGRFFATDLVGDCAAIPEFGRTRTFKLRAMRLTLQVLDPVVDTASKGWGGSGDPELKALKLRVTVQRDPTASRPIAAIVPFPKHAPPQCGINPGRPVVGALGALGQPKKNISYFGDPATFHSGESPASVEWKSIPFAKPREWNRDMLSKPSPSDCAAHFDLDATFRGKLIARRFLIDDARLPKKSKTFTLDGAVLKLDKPINICRKVASNHGTSNAGTMIQSLIHVSAFRADVADLMQLGAYNQKYIGQTVKIVGRVSGYKNPQLAAYNLPWLIVDRICLLRDGKPTACASEKRSF